MSGMFFIDKVSTKDKMSGRNRLVGVFVLSDVVGLHTEHQAKQKKTTYRKSSALHRIVVEVAGVEG